MIEPNENMWVVLGSLVAGALIELLRRVRRRRIDRERGVIRHRSFPTDRR